MIIGIFGDSFAANGLPYGWPGLLADTYGYTVNNFAAPSSSLFWSYKKLTADIDKVDVVIFVATSTGRLYHPDDNLQNIGTLWSVDAVLAGWFDQVNISNRPVFKAAKEYYSHLSQPDFDTYVHDQIIKSIQELCVQKNKRLILIPAVTENLKFQTVFTFPLLDITKKEIEATFNDTTMRLETKMIANHMCQENNKRLAKIVNNLLQGDTLTVNITEFEFKKQPNPELYWKIK